MVLALHDDLQELSAAPAVRTAATVEAGADTAPRRCGAGPDVAPSSRRAGLPAAGASAVPRRVAATVQIPSGGVRSPAAVSTPAASSMLTHGSAGVQLIEKFVYVTPGEPEVAGATADSVNVRRSDPYASGAKRNPSYTHCSP